AATLEGPLRSPLQHHGLYAPDLPRLGGAVVARDRDAHRRGAHVPLPPHHPPGQEHAQDAGPQT
ncbi:MAG: Inner membrane protein translocase and chaperone YidC, short form OxaI-like, partial [uncultured Rubrobacteraceae bacterium]